MSDLRESADDLLASARERIDEITAKEAKECLDEEDVVFLDVRDPDEIREDGIIPGSVHTSRGMVEFKADPETEYYEDFFDLETEYVCYCVVGLRSAFVTDRLDQMGYDIANLEGGIEAWKAVGGEIVADEDANQSSAPVVSVPRSSDS